MEQLVNLLTFASSQGLDINLRHRIIIFRLFFKKMGLLFNNSLTLSWCFSAV